MNFLFLTLFFLPLFQGSSLYVTFHGGKGGINNINKYSLSGKDLGTVLNTNYLDELRGMTFDSSHTLYVANSNKHNSMIVAAPSCGNGDVFNFSKSSQLQHPYGLAIDTTSSRIFVSNQDNDAVEVFNLKTGSFLATLDKVNKVRGICFYQGNLFVASEDDDAVHMYNTSSFKKVYSFKNIDTPIGVTVSKGILFVSSNGDTGKIFSFRISSGAALQTYESSPKSDLDHPAGLAENSGILYVLGQDNQLLTSFDVSSTQYHGILARFPDQPEQLVISPCS